MSRQKRNKTKRSRARQATIVKAKSFQAIVDLAKGEIIHMISEPTIVPGSHDIDPSANNSDVATVIRTDADKDHLEGFLIHYQDPPSSAKSLLLLFLRSGERDGALGDLIEKYGRKRRDLGKRHSKFWVYWEVAKSIGPLILRVLERIGVVMLGEWIKKHIS